MPYILLGNDLSLTYVFFDEGVLSDDLVDIGHAGFSDMIASQVQRENRGVALHAESSRNRRPARGALTIRPTASAMHPRGPSP